MVNFWVDMAISVILSTLKQVVKNPEHKEDLKRAMLKVYYAIQAAYPDETSK